MGKTGRPRRHHAGQPPATPRLDEVQPTTTRPPLPHRGPHKDQRDQARRDNLRGSRTPRRDMDTATHTTLIDRIDKARHEFATTSAHPDALVGLADSLKSIHNQALAHVVRTTLTEAFPDHDMVVFARSWDEDAPHLLQVLSGDPRAIEYDASSQEGRPDWMTASQWNCLIEAERLVCHIGTDEEIQEHFNSETEHEDWVEFQVPLR